MSQSSSPSTDVEKGGRFPTKIPHFRQVLDAAGITPEVESYPYSGSGTEDDPYVVVWIENDPRNPMEWSATKRWAITLLVAFALLAVALVSSAYSGGATEIVEDFGCSQEVYTLGISLFVLGFALGPLVWAPLSEIFGRQVIFLVTQGVMTAFNGGAIASPNIQSLIVQRFFAGAFGASPLTNAGGVIADMFPSRDRGLAMCFFSSAPFMGPVLGPIVGGFVGETIGWRWIEGLMTILTGTLWILTTVFLPETYPPVILRKRAEALSKKTGKVYMSRGDAEQGKMTFSHVFTTSLSRPWMLLFREPIVLLLSLYLAILYGTLYGLFGAFPVVFQDARGWSPGVGSLPFLGVAAGMIIAVLYSIRDNQRYVKISDAHDGFAPPEARLPPVIVGGIAVPIGLIWFAWTDSPSVQFMVSIIAGAPFGFGMVLVFLGVQTYLIDSYTIFAASALAANTVIRSIFGAAFPLFIDQMYEGIGLHWATMIPGFLALACVPFPFLFYKYGQSIRERCKYAAEADAFLKKMKAEGAEDSSGDDESSFKQQDQVERRKEGAEEREVLDSSSQEHNLTEAQSRPEPVQTTKENPRQALQRSKTAGSKTYEENPFDLDRINTQQSFPREAIKRVQSSKDNPRKNLQRSKTAASKTSKENPSDLDRVNTKQSFPGETMRRASSSPTAVKSSI